MAFLAALPEVAEAGGAAEGGAAASGGGGGMLSRLPLVGHLLGGGKGGSDKPSPEAAEQVAHEQLGALNARQFG